MSSIVIDTNVMTLYDAPIEPTYAELFKWLLSTGSLCISHHLLIEYMRSGNRNITILLAELKKHAENNRLIEVPKTDIKNFKDDKKFKYSCNHEDINHARLTFLSPRKKIITEDTKLKDDINKFKQISGIKPVAAAKPASSFYA